MRIVVACKAVYDSQDIQIAPDGSLDYTKAKIVISEYDKNALELGARLSDETIAIVVGGSEINNSKLKKDILARGIKELVMIADESASDLDAYATSQLLSQIISGLGDVDLIITGDGSADNYAQQVDVQLADALGLPVVTAVSRVECDETALKATRMLEDCTEETKVALPAVVSVTPDVAEPRIPGMRDILAAGKKPMQIQPVESMPHNSLETRSCQAPNTPERTQLVTEFSDSDSLEKVVSAIKAAL